MFYDFFFFNDTATTEIYTLSLHDALPIYLAAAKTNVKKIAGSYFMNHIQHQYSADELAKIGVDLIGDLGED